MFTLLFSFWCVFLTHYALYNNITTMSENSGDTAAVCVCLCTQTKHLCRWSLCLQQVCALLRLQLRRWIRLQRFYRSSARCLQGSKQWRPMGNCGCSLHFYHSSHGKNRRVTNIISTRSPAVLAACSKVGTSCTHVLLLAWRNAFPHWMFLNFARKTSFRSTFDYL